VALKTLSLYAGWNLTSAAAHSAAQASQAQGHALDTNIPKFGLMKTT